MLRPRTTQPAISSPPVHPVTTCSEPETSAPCPQTRAFAHGVWLVAYGKVPQLSMLWSLFSGRRQGDCADFAVVIRPNGATSAGERRVTASPVRQGSRWDLT